MMPRTSNDPATPAAPKLFHGVTLDENTSHQLRILGSGNLSRGIRIAAEVVASAERTPTETHILTAHLAELWGVTPEEITLRALQHFQTTVEIAQGMPTPPADSLNTRSRNAARDAEIVRHVRNGVKRATVAAKYRISLIRVHQIVAAAKAQGEYVPSQRSLNQQRMEAGMAEIRAMAKENLGTESILELAQPLSPKNPNHTNNIEGLPFSDEDLDDLFGAD